MNNIEHFERLKLFLLSLSLVVTALLSGCGGGGEGEGEGEGEGSAVKSTVVLIGQPDSPLADKLNANFQLTKLGAEPHAPVLVYLVDDGEYYDEEVINYLQKAYETGFPVVLLNPNSDDIEVFNEVTGFEIDNYYSTNDGISIYGVDRNNIGKESVLLVNALPPSATIPVTTNTYEEEKLVDTKSEILVTSASDEDLQDNITILREWINEEQGRNTVDMAATAKAREHVLQKVAEADQKNIIDLSTTGQITISLRGTYKWLDGYNPNTYVIDNEIWRIYDQDKNNDYILVNQSASLSAAGQIVFDSTYHRGFYVNSYQITSQLVDADNKPVRVYDGKNALVSTLEKTSIKTYSGTTSVSENFTWKLDGKISAKASQNPELGGEIAAGVSYSKTNSYQIPDVTVSNLSDSFNSKASTGHKIARPSIDKGWLGAATYFYAMKELSRATYEPSNQILFKLPDTAYDGNETLRNRFPSGIYLRTELAVVLGESIATEILKSYQEKTYSMPVYASTQIIAWPLFYPSIDIDNISPGKTVAEGDYRWQDLSRKDMSGVTFNETNLTGSLLSQATLKKATFSAATLVETNFAKSELSEAVFSSTTKFLNTKFQYANLQGASFRNANLKEVDFTGADLRGADLSGATIVNNAVNFSGTKLSNTKWYDGTICPNNANRVIKGNNNNLICVFR